VWRVRQRVTISLDHRTAARVRDCGARTRGGASAYLERLVRDDELREAAAVMAAWYDAHPGYAEDAIAETEAAHAETDR
jgi:hypothetical protein